MDLKWSHRTFMKDVAHWAIVQDHHFTEIRLHRAKVFDVCPIAERAVLSIVAGLEVLALLLEPVDHGIRVFLYTRGENHKLVPLANLAQEIVTVGSLMHIVQNRMLRSKSGLRATGSQRSGHGHR